MYMKLKGVQGAFKGQNPQMDVTTSKLSRLNCPCNYIHSRAQLSSSSRCKDIMDILIIDYIKAFVTKKIEFLISSL